MLKVIGNHNTVNVKIFAQYIFSRILYRALDALNFAVSENYNHDRTNRTSNWYLRKDLAMQTCHLGLDVRKFNCAKISAFTVC